MIGKARHAWDWFVDGLAEAALWAARRIRRSAAYRLEIADGDAVMRGQDGSEIGRATEEEPGVRFDPPHIVKRLAGAAIDIAVPRSWLFRRELDPVALQSVPFLDAFVRHHIERITPWRAADVHYRIRQAPLPGDPTRVAVEIGVVPKRIVRTWVAALESLRPGQLRIVPNGAAAAEDVAIPLGDGASRLVAEIRQRIAVAIVALALGFAATLGWVWWQASLVRGDIDEQDRVMDERKAVLARAQRRDQAGHAIDAKLRELRKARPRSVDVIEALAVALPDSAHLTDLDLQKDHLAIAGISTDTALLVPALEHSGRFADVAFGAATTRVESGQGDRFHLDMRVLDPAPASR